MAAEGDALATALSNHDRTRKSTDIPLFYGREVDTVKPQQLIDRIEAAVSIANWDKPVGDAADAANGGPEGRGRTAGAQQRCEELYLCLRDRAITWFHTLTNIPGYDNHNWNFIREEFLEAYAPKYTARTLCLTFQELLQKPGETVQDYYNKVNDAFIQAYRVKPAALTEFMGTDAQKGNANVASAIRITELAVNKMQLHVMNTLFLGGLREDLRAKVLEVEDQIGTIQNSVRRARALEVIVGGERKTKGHVISSIEDQPSGSKTGGTKTSSDVDMDERVRTVLEN